MIGVTEKLAKIRRFVDDCAARAGRDPAAVTIVAVGKRHPPELLAEAARAGQIDFGENFVAEAVAKQEYLASFEGLKWHFIGALQSNKTRPVAENFAWIHTLDRPKIAERLNSQRPYYAEPLNVCLQVNLDAEPTKAGVSPEALAPLANAVAGCDRLRLRGLMCIPRPRERYEEQRAVFARLRKLADELANDGLSLDTLSMGMSGDLAAAIAEGATLVRIGTAIFGPRP